MSDPRSAGRRFEGQVQIVREHQDRANLDDRMVDDRDYRCIWCRAWKSRDEFRVDNSHRDGRQRRCRVCDNLYTCAKQRRSQARRAGRLDAAGVTVVYRGMMGWTDEGGRSESPYQEAKRIAQERAGLIFDQ